MLQSAWTGEPFEYQGRTVRVTPRPAQDPHPPLFLGGSVEAAARRAARLGLGFFPSIGDRALAEAYRDECRRLGQPEGAVLLPRGPGAVFVTEDPERTWATIGEHLLYDAATYASWQGRGQRSQVKAEAATVDELRAGGVYQVLTPDEVVALAGELGRGGTITLHPLAGGIPPSVAEEGLDLVARKVLPDLRGPDGPSGGAPKLAGIIEPETWDALVPAVGAEEIPPEIPGLPPEVPGLPVPLGRRVELPGRGTTFVREVPGPPGAPTVLLLHGWIASGGLNWFQAFEPLSEHFRVVAPDLRGHGRGIRSRRRFRLADCADDVAALLDELGDVGPVIAVGYSMGGPVAQLLWKRHPERVRGLVICATGPTLRARRPGAASSSPRPCPRPPARRGAAGLAAHLPSRVMRRMLPAGNGERAQTHAGVGGGRDAPPRLAQVLEAGHAIGTFDSRRWVEAHRRPHRRARHRAGPGPAGQGPAALRRQHPDRDGPHHRRGPHHLHAAGVRPARRGRLPTGGPPLVVTEAPEPRARPRRRPGAGAERDAGGQAGARLGHRRRAPQGPGAALPGGGDGARVP